MRLIRLFKLILLVITFAYSLPVKPNNSKDLEIVKISDQTKTRTYYHLDKRGYLEYSNFGKFLDKDKDYTIKIISRTKLSKNSNSSKSFGFVLKIINNQDTTVKELKYKKKVSLSKVPNKRGFSYTNAGFWLEEIDNPSKVKLLIEPLKGSPEVDIRLVYDEIKEQEFEIDISPVNVVKPNNVYFLRDTTFVKSKKWYLINENNDFQFKIIGPALLKIRSRTDNLNSEDGFYSFKIEENGRNKISKSYEIAKSKKDAYYIDVLGGKRNLTRFNTMFFNVPPGLNYYLVKNSNESNGNVLVKIESDLIELR